MDTEQPLPRRIIGRTFLQALIDAGVIHRGDYVRRVVIDASIDHALEIYVERIGDERALAVAPLLTGLDIRAVVSQEADAAG